MSDPTGGPDHQHPDVGGLGEEAAKLLGAVSDWARDQGGEAGAGISQGLGSIAGAFGGLDEHFATGAPECTYCPVCRTVHVVRQTSPEVRAHLATAASSFLQAMAELVSALPHAQPTRPGSEFERIDLEDDEDDS